MRNKQGEVKWNKMFLFKVLKQKSSIKVQHLEQENIFENGFKKNVENSFRKISIQILVCEKQKCDAIKKIKTTKMRMQILKKQF